MMADVDNRRRDWSQLNPELLELISGTFTEISDHFRFRSVCRSWRSANTNLPLSRASAWPWLLLLPEIDSEEDEDCHVIIPFYDWRRFTLRAPYSLRMKSCSVFGSPHGYFLVFDKITGSVSITNPLVSGSWFTLPVPVPTTGSGRHINMHKVKIFKSDDSKIAVVVVVSISYTIFLEKTFLWRTGDSVWTQMYNDIDLAFDFVLYKGSFYFGGDRPVTKVLDSTTLAVTDEIAHPQIEGWHSGFMSYYLVESSCGKLLMVHWNHYKAIWVFQLDFSKRQPKWMRVRNIGDDTLFLSDEGLLMCFPTGQLGLFKKNCMYFVNKDGKVTFMNIEDNKLEILPHFIENRILAWMIPSCSRASCTSDNGPEDLRMMLDHETAKNKM